MLNYQLFVFESIKRRTFYIELSVLICKKKRAQSSISGSIKRSREKVTFNVHTK